MDKEYVYNRSYQFEIGTLRFECSYNDIIAEHKSGKKPPYISNYYNVAVRHIKKMIEYSESMYSEADVTGAIAKALSTKGVKDDDVYRHVQHEYRCLTPFRYYLCRKNLIIQ